MANANFENTPLSFIPLRQYFSDYTSSWYLLAGDQIIITMIINSLNP